MSSNKLKSTARLLVSRSIEAVVGGRAIELTGQVITPARQGEGIGRHMTDEFLDKQPTEFMTAYTRNPALIKMMSGVAISLYPLDNDRSLQEMASYMPHATVQGDATYHIDRYGNDGLFQGSDPAKNRLATAPQTLVERFTELKNIRTALVIASRINNE